MNRFRMLLMCPVLLGWFLPGCSPDDDQPGPTASPEVSPPPMVDGDGDGVPAAEDCRDDDAQSYPGAVERCDDLDNDCDEEIDEGLRATWYIDRDRDGYGDDAGSAVACTPPSGMVANAGDCEDRDEDIHPESAETCDGVDQDCDGGVDEGLELSGYHADVDGDGFGDPDDAISACRAPSGYVDDDADCDDTAAGIHPAADEACNDLDDDCDGAVDEGLPTSIYYLDGDADGYGDVSAASSDCVLPAGYVETAGDCDDGEATTWPGATEACDGRDNDCDSIVDDPSVFYQDGDGDGYGDPAASTRACAAPSGYVANGDDCDDLDGDVSPVAPEQCDGEDEDCDGAVDDGLVFSDYYPDEDADGYGFSEGGEAVRACAPPVGFSIAGLDCDDADPARSPGTVERCNTIDDDCDGQVDEEMPLAWFPDLDGDGFGTERGAACDSSAGFIQVRGDCDDTRTDTHPGASDVAGDGVDRDCGGTDGPEPHVGYGTGSSGTLQEALDKAVNGATIWVGPKTYQGSFISFNGKKVRLASSHLAEKTILNAGGSRGFSFGSGETRESILDGFTITGANSGSGGAISIRESSPTITGCIITKNKATSGGGINMSDASPLITRCTISNNTSDGNGAGVLAYKSDFTMTFCTITGNRIALVNSQHASGGGLAITDSSAVIRHCTISDNTANMSYDGTGCLGGGLYLNSGADVTLSHSLITGNLAWDGGGVYVGGSDPVISSTRIIGNTAAFYGGGVKMYGSDGLFDHVVIADNSAQHGGGVALTSINPSSTHTVFTTCLVTGNLAGYAGGAMKVEADATLTNCVLTGNVADYAGGGLYTFDTHSTVDVKAMIAGSILAYNTPDNVDRATGSVQVAYSDLYNPAPDSNHDLELDGSNLQVEPGFLSYDSSGLPDDVHLATGSALIDAGDPGLVDVDGSRADSGIFGGDAGDGWDLDGDGLPAWFWPGTIHDAPAAFDPADFDCDDLDPSVPMVTDCPG